MAPIDVSPRFFWERNGNGFAADLDFQRLRQKGKLAVNHRVNDSVVRPLRRNRLARELEQVVDLNRDRFQWPTSMPADEGFGETKPQA